MVASHTPVWPTMSGFAKFATMKSKRSDAIASTSASVTPAALISGCEVVGGDLGTRDEEPFLSRVGRLDATIEEVRDVGVLLGLGDVELAPARLRERLCERAGSLGRERHLDRQPFLVGGHRHDEQAGRRRAAAG